jgi:hypothetical protein
MNVNVVSVLLAAVFRFEPAPGSPVPVGPGATDVLLADLDGDRRLDVAVAVRAGVSVRLGDGRGGFGPAHGPYVTRGAPHLLAAADLDRDGRMDLLATTHDSHEVLVWHSAGFSPMAGSPYPVGRGAWSVALGDIDGDGRLDAVTADLEDGTLTVLLARADKDH